MEELKGFIEINIDLGTHRHSDKKLIAIRLINEITPYGHECEIITDNKLYNCTESYEEIKQLIKNAQ